MARRFCSLSPRAGRGSGWGDFSASLSLWKAPSSRPSPRTRGEGAQALRPYAIALHTRVKGAEEATEIRLNRNRILRLNADTERLSIGLTHRMLSSPGLTGRSSNRWPEDTGLPGQA